MATIIVDAGNGTTAGLMIGKKRPVETIFQSTRAAVATNGLGMMDAEFNWIEWEGQRYTFGDDTFRIAGTSERSVGPERYGSEYHQFLVAVAIAQIKPVSLKEVDLVLFCPPGYLAEYRERIIQEFMAAPVSIKYNGKSMKWSYKSVQVLPEGFAAIFNLLDKSNGQIKAHDILQGRTAFIDLGMFTANVGTLVDGMFNPNALDFATIPDGGVRTHIVEKIWADLRTLSRDFTYLTVEEVDHALRFGRRINPGGTGERDLSKIFQKYQIQYANWIYNNVVVSTLKGLTNYKAAILLGGGVHQIGESLSAKNPERIFIIQELCGISPEFANVYGAAKFLSLK